MQKWADLDEKKVISMFFFVISMTFFWAISAAETYFSVFFFAISRFFFWISFHISGFFLDKILEDYHDKNSKKQ